MKDFVQDHRRRMKVPGDNFEEFEKQLHKRVMDVERDARPSPARATLSIHPETRRRQRNDRLVDADPLEHARQRR